jgi:hypothetical protein
MVLPLFCSSHCWFWYRPGRFITYSYSIYSYSLFHKSQSSLMLHLRFVIISTIRWGISNQYLSYLRERSKEVAVVFGLVFSCYIALFFWVNCSRMDHLHKHTHTHTHTHLAHDLWFLFLCFTFNLERFWSRSWIFRLLVRFYSGMRICRIAVGGNDEVILILHYFF